MKGTRYLMDVVSFHIPISPIKYHSHFIGEEIESESLLELIQLLSSGPGLMTPKPFPYSGPRALLHQIQEK